MPELNIKIDLAKVRDIPDLQHVLRSVGIVIEMGILRSGDHTPLVNTRDLTHPVVGEISIL